MTKNAWRKTLTETGFTAEGADHIIETLLPSLQTIVDRLIDDFEKAAGGDRAELHQLPWTVAEYLKMVVDAIVLREEVTLRFTRK